jgi:hypothetical protein
MQGAKDIGTMAKSPMQAGSALKTSIKTQGLKGTIKGNADALKTLGTGAAVAGAGAVGAKALSKQKQSSVANLEAATEKLAGKLPEAFKKNVEEVKKAQDPSKPGAEKPDLGEKGKKKDDDKDEEKDKKASAAGYILNKIAKVENGGESKQGGEQLDNTAPVPSNPGREMISSNSAPASATKAKAKAPQKKLLSQVLTEPAHSKGTDSVVHENLRNASKGGVKIAAAQSALQKIAEEGCTCSGKGECKYCKLKAAKAKMEKKD